MAKPVPITDANVAEFLHGVDAFVCDCDGVLWTPLGPIDQAAAALRALRAIGKKVFFVSNNSTHSIKDRLDSYDFPVQEDEVAVPATVIARHLRQAGFAKKALVLGMEYFKDVLREAGVRVVPLQAAERVEESLRACADLINEDPEVGAVVLDVDVNIRYMDLCSAATTLRNRPDCLFLAGATDTVVPLPNEKVLLGPGPFLEILEQMTGRKAQVFGKPSPAMHSEYLQPIHGLDPRRTVFVGDALKQDMGFAGACGMQKLLVFSGAARPQDLDACPTDLAPDFILDSIAEFARLLPAQEATS